MVCALRFDKKDRWASSTEMRHELWRVRLEPGRPIGTTSAPPPCNPASNFPTIQAHRDSDKPSMREMGMALGTGEHRIEPPSRRAVFFSTLAVVLLVAGALTAGVYVTAGQKPQAVRPVAAASPGDNGPGFLPTGLTDGVGTEPAVTTTVAGAKPAATGLPTTTTAAGVTAATATATGSTTASPPGGPHGHDRSQARGQAHARRRGDRRPLQTVLKAIFSVRPPVQSGHAASSRCLRVCRRLGVAPREHVRACRRSRRGPRAGEARLPARAGRQVRRGDPHFVESLKLDAKAITLINLAACEEKTQKLADALGHWVEARGRAQTEGNAAIRKRRRAKALETRIPKLTVVLAGAPPDAEVARATASRSAWRRSACRCR